jgi:hypothetical protein
MYMCFVNWSAVLNLDLFWKQVFSYTGAQQTLWMMLLTLVENDYEKRDSKPQILLQQDPHK